MRRLALALGLLSAVAGAKSGRPRDEVELATARGELASGRWTEAERRLSSLAERSRAARVELGRLYQASGRRLQAKAIWNGLFDDYEQGRIDKRSAAQLTLVAIAGRELGSYQDASDLFAEAVAADPSYAPAHREWAATFLDRYSPGEAEVDALKAVALAPDDPEAHVLLARVRLEQGYDVAAANRSLDAALRLDPRHVGALVLRAELAADVEEWSTAERLARDALAANDKDVGARAALASVRLLRGDRAGFEAQRDAALAVDPAASGFFHRVAESFVKQHRYEEANDLEREALAHDPDDATALAAIGQNQLRLGDEGGGVASLRRAWDRDRWNVRTFNLLKLFEEVIPAAYGPFTTTHFRVRAPKSELPLLERVLAPLLDDEWRELSARYQLTPVGPALTPFHDGRVQIELYADPRHYAVRTVGLPNLEALGVTFGRVVTGRSPTGGKFNFGMMLWHEVGHVFSIQGSKNRVPRWFTEGLSEWETEHHDPTWRRHTHAELADALARGVLLPVAELNGGFVRARSVSAIVIAYHEAAEAVAFLIRRFGWATIPEALRRFGDGQDTPEVMRAVTGLSPVEFDAALQADLRARLRPYAGQFILPSSEYADLDATAEAARLHPTDGRALAIHALALLKRGDGAAAEVEIQRALRVAPEGPEALFASARLLAARHQPAAALAVLARMAAASSDGGEVQLRMGELAELTHDVAAAEAHYRRAAALDPEAAEPHAGLAQLLFAAHRDAEAIVELEQAGLLDVHDRALAALLLDNELAHRRWAQALAAAERAAWIDPFEPAFRIGAARAALALAKPERAVAELEVALLGNPPRPAAARGLLARALLAAGRRPAALEQARRALAEDPRNRDAASVK